MQVQVYTADPNGTATPIMVDAKSPPLTAQPVRVTLTKDCEQLCQPGWPVSPDQVGTGGPSTWYPRLIPSGTTITAFACVAAALIAAGAAVAA